MSEGYKDLSEIELGSEPIETEDFAQADPTLIQPGKYTSPFRRISARNKDDGSTTFQIEITGGISDGNGHTYNYVPRTWLSTKTYTPRNGKGRTSSVAQYLKALRQSVALTGKALLNTIAASQDQPIGVEMGLEDDPQERQKIEKNGALVPGPRRAYTRDFNKGTRQEPMYVGSIEKDGVTLKARARVEGFFAL